MVARQADIQAVIRSYKALYPDELVERYKKGERDFRGINLFRTELEKIFVDRFAAGQYIELPAASEDFNPLWNDYRWSFESEFEWDAWGHFIPVEFDDLLPMRDLSHVDLRGIDLSGSYLYRVKFEGANLSDAVIRKAQVFDCEWAGVDLNHADLRRTWFRDVDMVNANLYMSRLNRTRFSSCHLNGADLRRAKLRKAWLVWSDLTNAKLAKAHFDQTWLCGSNLSGVDFNDVDLLNTTVYEVTLANGQQEDFMKALRIRTG
ncbi:pentapeptide repeat-containing protein [Dehalococcoidales bacterium]|nr:pentapeptide repeat-containing protein [Dehalococcoidales bacterium]